MKGFNMKIKENSHFKKRIANIFNLYWLQSVVQSDF